MKGLLLATALKVSTGMAEPVYSVLLAKIGTLSPKPVAALQALSGIINFVQLSSNAMEE